MVTHDLIKKIKNGMYDETLKDIYVDEKKIAYERERYIKAIESYMKLNYVFLHQYCTHW